MKVKKYQQTLMKGDPSVRLKKGPRSFEVVISVCYLALFFLTFSLLFLNIFFTFSLLCVKFSLLLFLSTVRLFAIFSY